MSSRHTRKKASLARLAAKMESLRLANEAYELNKIVKVNLGSKNERSFARCPIANARGDSHSVSFREPRASGGASSKAIQALRAKGAIFAGCDMLAPDSASLAGQSLRGRTMNEDSFKSFQAKNEATRTR